MKNGIQTKQTCEEVIDSLWEENRNLKLEKEELIGKLSLKESELMEARIEIKDLQNDVKQLKERLSESENSKTNTSGDLRRQFDKQRHEKEELKLEVEKLKSELNRKSSGRKREGSEEPRLLDLKSSELRAEIERKAKEDNKIGN